MRKLSSTVGKGDAFRPIFACHYSPCGEESACAGYVAREGYSNINVRLLAAQGKIDLCATVEECRELDLWQSFDEMLEAYEDTRQSDFISTAPEEKRNEQTKTGTSSSLGFD